MELKHYNCKSCGYGPRPILMENKGAVAVLSDHMIGSGKDSYSAIVYPKRHIKQGSFMNEESELFASLFSEVVRLLGRAAHIDITTIGCHQADGIPGRHEQLIYEQGNTPRGHYFQKIFPARRIGAKELEDLTARLQKSIR